MDAGVDARTGTFVGSLANFSLPFSSLIVIESGSSFAKAAAVGLLDNVAANALSPILMVICCAMDLSLWPVANGHAAGHRHHACCITLAVARFFQNCFRLSSAPNSVLNTVESVSS